ncbi:MAG: trypsin-like peptidase domain-containing protein [Clostridia bacterium]|nr:trypsin-like peptidase domain-containing protein [Clostridia bacterium]
MDKNYNNEPFENGFTNSNEEDTADVTEVLNNSSAASQEETKVKSYVEMTDQSKWDKPEGPIHGGIKTTHVSDASQMPQGEKSTYSYTRSANPDISKDSNEPYRRPAFTPGVNTAYTGTNTAYTGSTPQPQGSYSYTPPQPKAAKKKKPKTKITGTMVILMLVFSMVFSGIWSAVFFIGGNVIESVIDGEEVEIKNSIIGKKESNDPMNSKESKVVVDQDAKGVAAAVNIAADSVVEIKTEVVTTSFFYGEYVQSGAGSGVIIDADAGYIITCAHVIDGASSVTVTLRNGKEYSAKVIGSDTQTDIAVIQIEADNLVAAATYDSDKLVVGQTAIAIGNPLGTLGGTVSSGIVSALDREITIDGQEYNLLQVDTSINPGNSGGGLFDIAGNLIGIVNAKSGGADGGTTIEGLGFAIPINQALEVANDLVEKGYVGGRVYLGINVYEITESTTQVDPNIYDYIYGTGVYFTEYQPGQNGDFLYGDKIIAIDGSEVSTRNEILSILNDYSVGDEVTVTVSRLNSDMGRRRMVDVKVTLIENVPEK